jgi:predicted deacylase
VTLWLEKSRNNLAMKANIQIESIIAEPGTIVYGFIDGEPTIPEKQIVVKKLQSVYNNRGGFIRYLTEMSEIVEYRQPLAEICDAFGRTIETITAPKKGILWSKSCYPMAFSRSTVCLLGTDISYE